MEATQSNHLIENYWPLLENLDANTRLALIARLAQSLQSGVSDAATTGSITPNPANRQPNNQDTETFWWDSLEE